jgi:chemotaxis protein methyltransferase CheR
MKMPTAQASSISPQDFQYVRDLVRLHSAIVLEPGKEWLVECRLLPIAHRLGAGSVGELVARLQTLAFGQVHRQVIEAITTNETSFFRDYSPFQALRTAVIPELARRRESDRRLHIWSAGCSSGQEPYSISMLIREDFPALASWNIRLLATDISAEVLERAREGSYTQMEVNRGLPASLLVKYFEKQGPRWRIHSSLRHAVEFREVNLAGEWPALPPMDLIFLRNVLIYFDVATKKRILDRVRRVLRSDGHLFLGSAETTINLDPAFEPVQIGKVICYRVRDPGARSPGSAP